MNLRHLGKQVLDASGFYRRRLRERPYRGVAVLAYHGIRSDALPEGSMPFEQLHVTARHFDQQCRVLRDMCRILTFDEWNRIAAGEMPIPERAALVTFDDGYRSVLTEALPILERHEIPAIVFLCTDPIERGRQFWFDSMAIRLGEGAVERVKDLPWREWREAVAQHETPADTGPTAPLTIDEVRTLASHPLVTIGSHSATHPLLGRAPVEIQLAELQESRAKLESWIERRVSAFAYPNGRPRIDYTADTIRALTATGFRHAFAVGHQFARYEMSRFEQYRFLMLDGMHGTELAHCLALSWPRHVAAS